MMRVLSIFLMLSVVQATSSCAEEPPPPESTSVPSTPVASTEPLTLSFGSATFPIIFTDEFIEASVPVSVTGSFAPLFGVDRPCVNPSTPIVSEQGLHVSFEAAGEYYIHLNDDVALKVVVLDRDEPISSSVVRIFDFCTANLLNSAGEDHVFTDDRVSYVSNWFLSDDPGMLICGPTHQLFEMILEDRFALPCRDVTFPGTYWRDGEIKRITHNMLEVYVPDVEKWVVFDLNYAFVVKWLSAAEIGLFLHKVFPSGEPPTLAMWDALAWDRHDSGVSPRFPKLAPEPVFREALVSQKLVASQQHQLGILFLGGPAYRGIVRWAGTPFLEAQYCYGSLQKDEALREHAIEWVKTYDLEVVVYPLDELVALLDAGHAAEIARAAWRERIAR